MKNLVRKTRQHFPDILVGMAVVFGLIAVTCFLVGIWTPDWQAVGSSDGFTNCDSRCWKYAGDDRWFHTAWLFALLTAGSIAGRVAWEGYNNDHGH